MIIHDSKLIFLHIPKTGGSSIEAMLDRNKLIGERDKKFGSHHRLEQIYERYSSTDTPPDMFRDLSDYHMFTVSRNPWERYASLYIHDKISWEGIPKNHKRTFVNVDEYMETKVSEHFFRAIEVNGKIPNNLIIIDFHNYREEIKRVFGLMGIKPGRILHSKKKTPKQKRIELLILRDTDFQAAVLQMCKKEIELFGYDLPIEAV